MAAVAVQSNVTEHCHKECWKGENCLGLLPGVFDAIDVRRHVMTTFQPPRRVASRREEDKRFFAVRQHGQKGVGIYERMNFTLVNERGLKLRCCHWEPSVDTSKPRPCVVFCHGMCSCRYEAQLLLPYLLCYDISVFSFDFSGAGQSEGEYVSFGQLEQLDLKVVIEYLQRRPCISEIGLWGFSMGAVAALLRVGVDDSIKACVFDSAYTEFKSVAMELAHSRYPFVPQMVLNFGWEMLCSEASSKLDVDLNSLAPIKATENCVCPAFFVVASEDNIVPPAHTGQLYDAWRGAKELYTVSGGHSSERPHVMLLKAAKFLCENLGAETAWFPERSISRQAMVFEIDAPVARNQMMQSLYDYSVSV